MDRKSHVITMVAALSSVIGITMLTHFAITQLPDETKSAIDVGIDVNAFDATGVTPLMQAAVDGEFERGRILLDQGADPNIRSANSDHDYALNYALLNGGITGSLALARLLIEHGADVNVKNNRGMTPIHMMASFVTNLDNRKQIMSDLVQHGADVNAQNEDGTTMLHIAATNDDWLWVDYVNKNYGQILNYEIRDKRGRTPLDLAIELGHVSVNDADSVENSMRKRPVYIGNNFDGKATDDQGRNGLQLAIIRSDMKFVQGLTPHTDLAHQDTKGETALHYAVQNQDPLPYVKYLLEAKSPINIIDKEKETPLMLVPSIRNSEVRRAVAKLLVEAGSPIANKNIMGKTVIDKALAVGDKALAEYLKQKLVDRNFMSEIESAKKEANQSKSNVK